MGLAAARKFAKALCRNTGHMIPRLLKRLKPKARSVIITVYGDSISHHGGSAWLGSVIELVEPLGLNERAVRTSAFRLAKENWLVAEQIGRQRQRAVLGRGSRRAIEADGDASIMLVEQQAAQPLPQPLTRIRLERSCQQGSASR